MKSLDVFTTQNILNYLSNPEESNDKNYSKERQKIGKELKREYKQTREMGSQVDSNYLLNRFDSL